MRTNFSIIAQYLAYFSIQTRFICLFGYGKTRLLLLSPFFLSLLFAWNFIIATIATRRIVLLSGCHG